MVELKTPKKVSIIIFGRDYQKLGFVGLETLKLGVTDTVLRFNEG